jgi:hypothetical protein
VQKPWRGTFLSTYDVASLWVNAKVPRQAPWRGAFADMSGSSGNVRSRAHAIISMRYPPPPLPRAIHSCAELATSIPSRASSLMLRRIVASENRDLTCFTLRPNSASASCRRASRASRSAQKIVESSSRSAANYSAYWSSAHCKATRRGVRSLAGIFCTSSCFRPGVNLAHGRGA